jgi:dihydrodipicolinate synthase/N-acetylneuraminate lyase
MDWPSLAREIRFCLEAGAHGLVCNVNASESWTLSDEERDAIAQVTVEQVGHHIPVIVGVSAGSLEVSAQYARHAQEVGADAVMAMPPPSRMGSPVDATRFYEGLASAVDLPVVIQNHDAPLGTRMSPELVSSLVNNVPGVDWIKEETIPPGQAISRQLELCSEKLKGIMGGMAGRYLLDEYRRGSAGTMPACESTDVHATIWNLLEAGQTDEARDVFGRLLPLLNYEALSSGVYKTVLHWRGVLETDYLRSVSGNPLDGLDRAELRAILGSMQDLFAVYPPAGSQAG